MTGLSFLNIWNEDISVILEYININISIWLNLTAWCLQDRRRCRTPTPAHLNIKATCYHCSSLSPLTPRPPLATASGQNNNANSCFEDNLHLAGWLLTWIFWSVYHFIKTRKISSLIKLQWSTVKNFINRFLLFVVETVLQCYSVTVIRWNIWQYDTSDQSLSDLECNAWKVTEIFAHLDSDWGKIVIQAMENKFCNWKLIWACQLNYWSNILTFIPQYRLVL